MQIKRTRRPSREGPLPAALDDPWAGDDAAWECDDDLRADPPHAFMRFFRGTAVAVIAGLAVWAALIVLLLQAA